MCFRNGKQPSYGQRFSVTLSQTFFIFRCALQPRTVPPKINTHVPAEHASLQMARRMPHQGGNGGWWGAGGMGGRGGYGGPLATTLQLSTAMKRCFGKCVFPTLVAVGGGGGDCGGCLTSLDRSALTCYHKLCTVT